MSDERDERQRSEFIIKSLQGKKKKRQPSKKGSKKWLFATWITAQENCYFKKGNGKLETDFIR